MAFKIKYLALGIALATVVSVGAYAVVRPAPPRDCAPVGDMAKRLMTERKLSYLADAIDSDDHVHMWYVSKKSGKWVELYVEDDKQLACIVREGYDWHYAG
ncbi:MAG: hypothetical protein PSY14_05290 [bacterium]|nr:hypothetical protein [bacterium]